MLLGMSPEELDVTYLLDDLEARLTRSASECLDVSPTASIADVRRAFAAFAARLDPCRFALRRPALGQRAERLLHALRLVYFQAVLERATTMYDAALDHAASSARAGQFGERV